MHNIGSIKYITQENIDKKKWNECINASANGLIYAYSFYLDAMAKNWDGLVLNDYEAIMPLAWNKKWGIRYLYQPPFTQQLGIFSQLPTTTLVSEFITALKKHFSFAEIFLNFKNEAENLSPKNNFILPLDKPYDLIHKNYSGDAVRNIRRSEKFHLQYLLMDDLHEAINLYQQLYAARTKHITKKDYHRFEELCLYAKDNKMLVLRKVVDENHVLQALALLLQMEGRLYLLQSSTLPAGRVTEANYFLLDNIIKEFSQQDLILDFEGSDIPGIADFYKNFGTINQPYYYFSHNELPWPLKLLK